jgi:hypothetical protein
LKIWEPQPPGPQRICPGLKRNSLIMPDVVYSSCN